MTDGRMRAIVVHRFGDASELVVEERPVPDPGPTEILVRVVAAGVNPVDWWTRRGEGYLTELPMVVGWDVAGIVEAVNDGVTLYRPGDAVLGMPRFPAEAGCYAEYVVAPARHFVAKPAAMPFDAAAGLPLAGLTAWQALVDTADVQPGQRVLVTAAAGGVGHLAVQIAKALGAYVIASASARKHELLKDLGADEVVDYQTVDLAATVRDIDLVVDAIGGTNSERLMPTLRPGGTIIPVFGGATDEIVRSAERHGVDAVTLLVEPDRVGLLALVELVEAGRLRVVVGSRWPLDQAAAAHQASEGGRATGKIVLTESGSAAP